MAEGTTDESKLKRLLYLTQTLPRFVSGDPEKYFLKNWKDNLEIINTNLKNVESFIKTLTEASSDELLPRRITLFYALAYALTKIEPDESEIRHLLASTTSKICRTDEEFFKFVSLYTWMKDPSKKNKITSAVGGAINRFLANKSPMEYAHSVGRSKGYHSWKYKDLIKLSHYKEKSDEKTLITAYVLFGIEKLENHDSEVIKKIHKLLDNYERLKKTEDEEEASVLVKELHASFSNVNTKFIKSDTVWSAIICEISTREVLRLLPKFYKFGLLKANCKSHGKVVEALTSLQRIKDCKLHPLEVFIYTKDFEKGGKPLDPKLIDYLKTKNEESGDAKEKIEKARAEPKCPLIMDSLGKCLKYAYPKDPCTIGMKKKIVIALDVTQHSNTLCFKNKNISCLEAELALTLYYFKTEKNVNVTLYNDKEVKGFNLDKTAAFSQSLKKLQDSKSEYMHLHSVFDWASAKKKDVDLFICLIQSMQSLSTMPKEAKPSRNAIKDAFLKYQRKMKSPFTKLVVICLGSHNFTGFPEIHNSLGICGFCPETPRVIEAFVKGHFS